MNNKILCVDDEANVLQGIKRTLRGTDFEIHTAEGGQAAIETISTNGPFAVVVTDMRMPEMDGVTLLTHVKQQAPDTVRIMLTGNAGSGHRNKSRERRKHLPLSKQTLRKRRTRNRASRWHGTFQSQESGEGTS